MERHQRLTVKLIGILLLQVTVLYGEASAQARELTEASHALYRGEYDRASEIARKYLKLHPGSAAMHVMLARAELTANRRSGRSARSVTGVDTAGAVADGVRSGSSANSQRAEPVRRQVPGVERGAEAGVGDVQDLLPVQRQVDGLPDLDVVVRRLRGVQSQVQRQRAGAAVPLELLVALERVGKFDEIE